jgi:anaerobic selenocysteine-containing dehydrogenase
LLYPQKRVGPKGAGQFARITWDEALDTIAERLQAASDAHGSESILPYSYAGTMGLLNGSGMDRRFFHRIGASLLDRTICSAAGMEAMTRTLGDRFSTEPEQFRHSKLIIAWGANILGTNVHLWPFIVEARRNGAKFYTIDPVMTRAGKTADKHFFLNPGSDMALALGMVHVIVGENLHDQAYIDAHVNGFDELRQLAAKFPPERAEALTGIPRADIVSLAREYATTRPAAIRVNYGVQRSERGGNAIRAVATLPAITGSWKEVGGGLQLSTSHAFRLNGLGLQMPELQNISPLGRPARLINMVELGKALTELNDPPVKALVVYNSNPAAIAPNQNLVWKGLRRDDLFTVVMEQFQTDTAKHADIVLPSTTFLEHSDLYYAYGHYYLQLARPALPAPGETKPNTEVFRLLAQRMGLTDPALAESDDDMIRTLLSSGHPFLEGITLERLEREHFVRLNVSPEGQPFLPFANGGFGTKSGKCELGAESLDYVPPVESRLGSDAGKRTRYPLEFISSKNDDSMNATFGNRPDTDRQTSMLWMHADDARARGIENGDRVRVFNDRGSCLLTAEVDGLVRDGVVRAPAIGWGVGANALTSDALTDIGNGPVLYSCLVQVERCGD